jgi:hypothetical protein
MSRIKRNNKTKPLFFVLLPNHENFIFFWAIRKRSENYIWVPHELYLTVFQGFVMSEFDKFMKEIARKGYKVIRSDKRDFGERLVAELKRGTFKADYRILIYHFSRIKPSIKDFLGFMKDFEMFHKTYSSKFDIKGGYFVTYGKHDRQMKDILKNYKDREVSDLIKIKSLKEEVAIEKPMGEGKVTRVRRKIPKHIKEVVWARYIGANKAEGRCCVCRKTIHFTDFEVGHDKAFAKGGDDNIGNLRPVCRSCNLAMGIMSIKEFKSTYFGKT